MFFCIKFVYILMHFLLFVIFICFTLQNTCIIKLIHKQYTFSWSFSCVLFCCFIIGRMCDKWSSGAIIQLERITKTVLFNKNIEKTFKQKSNENGMPLSVDSCFGILVFKKRKEKQQTNHPPDCHSTLAHTCLRENCLVVRL